MKIAILVSDNLLPDSRAQREDVFELDEEMGKLVPAFGSLGMTVDLVRWREASERASEFDAMLPLFVWDYFEGNETVFMSEMAKASRQTRIFNSYDTLMWNANKSYLEELERAGAPVIETYTLDRVTKAGVAKAFEDLGTETLVIKPQIGGGAWRQVLYKKGDPFPEKDTLPPGAALVQAFLPSVKSEGEYSFLYFGGQFSHALVKRPKDGDYRIQSLYGGTEAPYAPNSRERQTARSILDCLDFTPLYARVDLLRGTDNQLKLIELEMIEPYLYLPFADGEGADNKGALKLGMALKKRLETDD